jgi:hypothetical protein
MRLGPAWDVLKAKGLGLVVRARLVWHAGRALNHAWPPRRGAGRGAPLQPAGEHRVPAVRY